LNERNPEKSGRGDRQKAWPFIRLSSLRIPLSGSNLVGGANVLQGGQDTDKGKDIHKPARFLHALIN
jgi:hypothetical protein